MAIENARETVEEAGFLLEFDKNETVLSAPTALPVAWVLQSGAATLTLSQASGGSVFRLLGPGDIFGSSFRAFEGAKVRTKTRCSLLSLQGDTAAEVAERIADYWTARLIKELERDARLTPSERIERAIADWARKAGTRLGGGILLEGIYVKEVADRAKVSRTTVYAVIKALEQQQKLTRSGSAFLVKDAMLAEDGLAA